MDYEKVGGIRVTWLGFHNDSPHIFGSTSAAVECVFSLVWNKFDNQNLANAAIKILQMLKSNEDYIENPLMLHYIYHTIAP